MKNITEQEAKVILSERGHTNFVTVKFPKQHVVDTHEHPFDVDIVIVSGSIKIVVADKEYNLTPGDEFQLGAGIEHSEFMGEDGCEEDCQFFHGLIDLHTVLVVS